MFGQRLSQQAKDTDVETLTKADGSTKATYGYTAYGSDDKEAFTGIDKPDAQQPGKEPFNFYRYTGKRFDPHSDSYDMGFRDYSPGLNRFLTRDNYNGALADLNLSTDPWTNNLYSLAGGNSITGVEIDGHCAADEGALIGCATLQGEARFAREQQLAQDWAADYPPIRVTPTDVIVAPSHGELDDATNEARESLTGLDKKSADKCAARDEIDPESFVCEGVETSIGLAVCRQHQDWCTRYAQTEEIPIVVEDAAPAAAAAAASAGAGGSAKVPGAPADSTDFRRRNSTHTEPKAYRDLKSRVQPGSTVHLLGERPGTQFV